MASRQVQRTVIVTGGAGFIGSALVRRLVAAEATRVVTLDALTYAGHRRNLAEVASAPNHRFAHLDILDAEAVAELFAEERPTAVVHLAAESHVDRSIDGPEPFVRTNVVGTQRLLEVTRRYLAGRPGAETFRFLHVSTDEVYGSLEPGDPAFSETSPYRPRSPYAASKAAGDHLARAYRHTYGLPVIVTNCSNNFGPYQYPEKLIPLTILKAVAGEPVPVYGDGSNVRDWLYVEDHVSGLVAALERGRVGETYLIGGGNERSNLEVVETVLGILNELASAERDHRELLTFVSDRPGHDFRYAVAADKIRHELGWRPEGGFDSAMHDTVEWYLTHRNWCEAVTHGRYRLERLGSPA